MALKKKNTEGNVDFHIHTSYSDGTCSPSDVVEMAVRKNLRAISITDHDCVDVYPLVSELAARFNIEVVPGVELSSEIEKVDIHILGYFIDVNNSPLKKKLKQLKQVRYERAKKIVGNLNKQGIDLRFETVLAFAGEGAIGRPHIASAMLKEELVYSFKEAFDKYIGYDCPAYVEKLTLHPKEVFDLIREAGGLPVIAHPGITGIDERIPEFIKQGLAGLEALHPDHTRVVSRHYMNYCHRHGLIYTGGSDFHSQSHSKVEVGNPAVPYSVFLSMREALEQTRS